MLRVLQQHTLMPCTLLHLTLPFHGQNPSKLLCFHTLVHFSALTELDKVLYF